MQELHLVGFTTDRRHLIFSSRQGAKSGSFLVPVDEELLNAVDGLSADAAGQDDVDEDFDEEVVAPATDTRVDAKLSVREVQARLRAGVVVEEIAARAEVDPAWVERFAPPIRAEQQQVVTRALATRMERPRAGQSALTLRDAVARSMAERDLTFTAESFASAWSSRLVGADLWSIEFTFSHRGRHRTVAWTFEAAERRLTTSDRLASQIGFVAGDGATSSRAGTRRTSADDGDRLPSDGGEPTPGRRPATKRATRKPAARKSAAKKKSPVKKKSTAKKKSAAKKSVAARKRKTPAEKKRSPAKRKSAAKKQPAKKKATAPRKRLAARKKALPTATRVAAARKDATERLEQATAKRVAAARKAAERKSASVRKKAERRLAAEKKAAARAAREAEVRRREDEEAETESAAAKAAAHAVASAERKLAEERSSAARDAAERAAAAATDVVRRDMPGAAVEAEPSPAVEAEPSRAVEAEPSRAVEAVPSRAVEAVDRRRDQAVVRLRAPLPSVPPEDPAARVAARRARAAERSVSTAQFRSGSAVQAASVPVNGAGAATPGRVRRREPQEESPAGGGDGRPRPDGRRTRTRQLRAR